MYRGLFLADIHIGAMSYPQTYDECMYLKELLQEYRKDGILDFIIIGGDFFDKQLYGNDPFIDLAMKLMVNILISAKVVRIVYGTSSHDSDQYGIFDALAKDVPVALEGFEYNFRIITTVEEEELLPDMKVLYIPEEYIFNKKDYYAPYLDKLHYYDYIFGHGMIYEAFSGRVKKQDEKDTSRRRTPMFSSVELGNACNGDVLFGHYHIHSEMSDNVSYVGSFSRWVFGEEEDKGFYQLTFDPETRECKKTFVINAKALKLITYRFGYKDSVFKSTEEMEKTAQMILKNRIKYQIDRLRIIFNIPVGYENPEALVQFFTNRFKDEKYIRVEFSNGYVEQKKIEAHKAITETIPEEYKIFVDKNVLEEDKVSQFLKLRRGVDMSPEKIKKYLGL